MADVQTIEIIQDILDRHAKQEGPLLPILHSVQAEYGFIPADVVQIIADYLNITRAEVHGVISFYHDFRDAPAGKHVIKICRAEACQSVGANALSDHALEKLGVEWGGTTTNGAITIEAVYCLGLCACGPAAMVGGKVVGRVDGAKLDKLLVEAGA